MLPCLSFILTFALSLVAASVIRSNPCPPEQLCSRCPRQDNRGHQLQDEPGDAGYVHCQYQDTDCYYGPRSQGINIAFSFPDGACPPTLGNNICADVVEPTPTLLSTRCPDFNFNFIHVPLRSQPSNTAFIQCHYSSSECFYDPGTGFLATPPSIPLPNPPTVPSGVCPTTLVTEHLQLVV